MSAAIVLAVVGGVAHGAAAWNAVVSGHALCSDSEHVVTWSIGNSESGSAMTVVSASASLGDASYAVTGYSSVVVGGGSTSATTTVPADVIGTIVLTVRGSWPNGESATASTAVALEADCTTPTSTQSSTTTSIEVSPTSVVKVTTTRPESTTVVTQGATGATTSTTGPATASVGGVTSTTVSNNGLPLTGSAGWPPLLGISAVVLGVTLSFVSRRRRATALRTGSGS